MSALDGLAEGFLDIQKQPQLTQCRHYELFFLAVQTT